jgi:putative SOS response-associated peptidase YedK
MPLFLPRDRWNDWMNPNLQDLNVIRALMNVAKPDEHLRYWPVADLVNSIRNNGAELISPIQVEPETLF